MPPALPTVTSKVLTGGQQQKINDLIKLHHYALIIELMGDKAVPPSILTQVKSQGLYRKPRPDVLHRSFVFGGASFLDPKVLHMGPTDFDKWMARKGLVLDTAQREVLDSVRESFSGYLKSLADDMAARVDKAVIKANRSLVRQLAQKQRQSLFLEVERRKALASIAKDLTDISAVQLSNAIRTVETETNNAYQDGRALEIVRKAGHENPLVFKRPRTDACEDCKKAYLEDDGKTPRVFRLQELIANGSNIGKSRVDRMPVLDSFHPYCFPGDTPVLTAQGEVAIRDVRVGDRVLTHAGRWQPVVQLHERFWAGWLQGINGAYATPDHPYLTNVGWLPAKALQSASYLRNAREDVLSLESKDGPPALFQVARFGGILLALLRRVMPHAAVDFNGQLQFGVAEINIEALNAEKSAKRKPFFGEYDAKGPFQARQILLALGRLGAIDAFTEACFAPASGGLCSLDSLTAFLGAEFCVHDDAGLTGRASGNSVLVHAGRNRCPSDAEDAFHLQDGSFFGVVKSIEQFFREFFTLHHFYLTGAAYSMCNRSSSRWFEGHVFNLSVAADETYSVGGVVVHNCACELGWLPPGFEFNSQGRLVLSAASA